jgi:hypothetical protein
VAGSDQIINPEWIMTLYSWLGIRRRQQARDALVVWKRQGHGVISLSLTKAILYYRRARCSQAEIMALLKVSKALCTATRRIKFAGCV